MPADLPGRATPPQTDDDDPGPEDASVDPAEPAEIEAPALVWGVLADDRRYPADVRSAGANELVATVPAVQRYRTVKRGSWIQRHR